MLTDKIHSPNQFLKDVLEGQGSGMHVQILKHKIKTVDGFVKVNGHPVLIEFKQEINPQNIVGIENQLLKYADGEHLIAIANYITPKAK